MKRAMCIVVLATLSSTNASATDKRIQTLLYDSEQIVQIVGQIGIQSTISFGPDERIENVAVGDSSSWQITPNRRASLLFLKPLLRASRTNMTVVTDRHVYMFDLVAGTKNEAPMYALKFAYPNEEPAVPETASQIAEGPATPPIFSPQQLNFGWTVKGSGRLHPRRVFDDGKALYMEWDRDASLPAILSVSGERVEGPVDYRVSGDYIVVDPMPSNILLRQGKKTATILPGNSARRHVAPPSEPAVMPAPIAATPSLAANRTASALVQTPNVAGLFTSKLAGADNAQ